MPLEHNLLYKLTTTILSKLIKQFTFFYTSNKIEPYYKYFQTMYVKPQYD